MSLALGNPALIPQLPVSVSGFKPQIEAETRSEPEDTQRDLITYQDEGITGVSAPWHNKNRKKNKKDEGFAGEKDNLKKTAAPVCQTASCKNCRQARVEKDLENPNEARWFQRCTP